MPADIKCYDAHCHLLNKDFLLQELAEIFLFSWWRADQAAQKGEQIKSAPLAAVGDLLAWGFEILGALNGKEKEQALYLLGHAQEFWGADRPVALVPQMMDIRYMFARAVDNGQKVEFEAEFDGKDLGWTDAARKDLLEALQRAGMPDSEAHALAGRALESLVHGKAHAPESYAYSGGFSRHREALTDLKLGMPENVFPFFAVDPRRRGVVEAVIRGDFVGKGKPFRGVKLYPRLGYHPECDALAPLFAWCENERIPIVTHCSYGGFPPLMNKHRDFGAPSSFARVLEKHRRLIIDFAHFGAGNCEWAEGIAQLMVMYPHVYSDLACYEDPVELAQFERRFWKRVRVRDRTMFGTDYGLMYLFKVASVGTYYYNFQTVFGQAELEHMNEVATVFLG